MSFGCDELKLNTGHVVKGLRVGMVFVVAPHVGQMLTDVECGTSEPARGWLVLHENGRWCVARLNELADAMRVADDIMLYAYEHVSGPDDRDRTLRAWLNRMIDTARYEPFPGARNRAEVSNV